MYTPPKTPPADNLLSKLFQIDQGVVQAVNPTRVEFPMEQTIPPPDEETLNQQAHALLSLSQPGSVPAHHMQVLTSSSPTCSSCNLPTKSLPFKLMENFPNPPNSSTINELLHSQVYHVFHLALETLKTPEDAAGLCRVIDGPDWTERAILWLYDEDFHKVIQRIEPPDNTPERLFYTDFLWFHKELFTHEAQLAYLQNLAHQLPPPL
jgi:hypothetical protein